MSDHEKELGREAVPKFEALAHFIQVFESLGVLVLLVALVVVASIIAPGFSTYTNIANTIIMASITAATGLGMTFAIAVGGFDLSVGSVQALTAIVVASLLAVASVPLAIVGALLTGLLLGLFNGLIISKLKIPAFVVTFGMMSIVRGVALLATQGQSVMITNHPDFATLNNGKILAIPVPFIIVLMVLAALYLILHHTPFGRHTCAIGGNRAAAIASGINVDRVTIAVFGLVGVTAAISGVMLSSQLMIVDGTLGTGLELQAIAISVLGGTSLWKRKSRRNRFGGIAPGDDCECAKYSESCRVLPISLCRSAADFCIINRHSSAHHYRKVDAEPRLATRTRA